MAKCGRSVNKGAVVKFAHGENACGTGPVYLRRPGSFRDRWAKCTHGTWMAWLLWVAVDGDDECLSDKLMSALEDFVADTFDEEFLDPLEYVVNMQERELNRRTTVRGWNKKLSVLIRKNISIEDVEELVQIGMAESKP